ncbi:DUF4183 domain-containing protein [Rummeliibacillus sp. POC4]|uniref:DUF4183 domain-containing protein n=1 Tax=Rummeliibacillus sp. POC4 TaxID=2305899 RepID=UPI000E676128|nr:DUF4183 domain-containing protein [Rummeliibacillus sp. POC4]RIJ66939.1 DUF4183 domain-containing protein [Rummeliibacillus sp. POC4]
MAIVKPFIASRKFISTIGAGTVATNDVTFANTDFTDDTGGTSTFPSSPPIVNLYVNGVLQTNDTLTGISTTAVTIVGGAVLDPATPITLEFVIN